MDEFSLLQYFSEQPASDGGADARSLATPCGLEVRFDGTWESWSSDDVRAADAIGKAVVEATPAAGKWDAYSWEQSARGSWN